MALSMATQEAVWLRRMHDNPQANPKNPTVILKAMTADLLKKPLSNGRFETLGMNMRLVSTAAQCVNRVYGSVVT